MTSTSRTARCGPACRVVLEPPGADPHAGWCGRGATHKVAPYADLLAARKLAPLIEAQHLEQWRQVAKLLARGRRRAAGEVEHPPALPSAIRKPPDLTTFV